MICRICIRNTRGPWATMLTWVNSYKSLIQHFRLSVAMAINQNEEFVQLLYAWWRTTQQTFIKKFCQNTCSEITIKTYFHFSHYMSMESLSCHSNESTWAMAIKNIIFVEANVMNISAKFQLHPPYGFWGDDFWIFFSNSSFWLPWQPIKFRGLDKIHMFGRGLLKEHLCKTFVKISAMKQQ